MKQFDMVRVGNVMVPMRDGVHLAADIYRPARDGAPIEQRFPVVLERTPYDKRAPSRSEIDLGCTQPQARDEVAGHIVERGFVVIYQDCRGRYDSEGRFEKYLCEAEDGEDTLRWLAQQDWFNGKVGTMGLSYAAHTQLALATQSPPGLCTFVLDSGGFSDAFQCGIRHGGAFEMKQVVWAFNQAKEALGHAEVAGQALHKENLAAWFKALPWRRGHSPLSWAPEYEAYLFEQWSRTEFTDYWKQPGIYARGRYDAVPAVPQVHMSSWYDVYVKSTLENFTALSYKHKAVRLIMGPWLHGDRNITHSGDVDFGPTAAFDGNIGKNWVDFRVRWFDRWLNGVDNGVDREPKVLLFLMGGGSGRRNAEGRLEHGGRWIQSTTWPLPEARIVHWHLRGDHVLACDGPAPEPTALSYRFDPRNPVPTIGGSLTSGRPLFEGGAFDQREDERFFGCETTALPLSARHDVLVFETPPLAEDVAVIGPVCARLFVSTDGPDTDITIKLIDVHPPSEEYPQGFAMNITDGILRCRYRDSWESPKPMTPGEVCEIRVEAFATANLFKAGHRIRLDISSSNFPKYDINPNTGENFIDARISRVAVNTLYTGGAYPSHLALSVAPVASLRPWRCGP